MIHLGRGQLATQWLVAVAVGSPHPPTHTHTPTLILLSFRHRYRSQIPINLCVQPQLQIASFLFPPSIDFYITR
ncbi:hypothetical protein F4859DRAFT_495624 [Xylaria cf. heliscus]|nr:hypothetical protein F4859DRAFT_495624 [Xylaria cf. heliscus]